MTDHTTSAERAVRIATDFLKRSGMSPVDFARRIHYDTNTLQQFMCGHYSRITDASRISAAILDFMATDPLDEDGEDFIGTIYETATVRALRNVFAELLDYPQAFMVYAPSGSGKTDLARHLIKQHNAQRGEQKSYIFRIYCRAAIRPRDLLKRVATACGTQSDTGIERALHNLRWDFRKSRVVLYFDEAQHLSIDCFETLRELLDEKPHMSLCFAGDEDLDAVFTKFAGKLERLERRITDKITLPPLTADEAAGILRSELSGLAFDQAAIRQQIELATTTVRVDKKIEKYISIGRLKAAIRQIQKGMAAQETKPQKVEAIA
jgi:DNA transposition AAA+ family ATPase